MQENLCGWDVFTNFANGIMQLPEQYKACLLIKIWLTINSNEGGRGFTYPQVDESDVIGMAAEEEKM